MQGCVSERKHASEICDSRWKYRRVGGGRWLSERLRDTQYGDDLTSNSVNSTQVYECQILESLYEWVRDKMREFAKVKTKQSPCMMCNAQWQMPRWQGSCGQHGAHLCPGGPRWAPLWPYESCYEGGLYIPLPYQVAYCITTPSIDSMYGYSAVDFTTAF